MKNYPLSDQIVDFLLADAIGLYEVYWMLEDGPIRDADFGYSKTEPWTWARDVVLDLVRNGRVRVLELREGARTPVVDPLAVVHDKAAWHPFNTSTGPGYLLDLTSEEEQRRSAPPREQTTRGTDDR